MPFVKRVVPDDRVIRSLQPTHVECRYMVKEINGRLFLQLNSYGSDERKMPDKLSQTLQFDEASARELWEVLGRNFGFK